MTEGKKEGNKQLAVFLYTFKTNVLVIPYALPPIVCTNIVPDTVLVTVSVSVFGLTDGNIRTIVFAYK